MADPRRTVVTLRSTPSTRKRTTMSLACGSKCMSEAPSSTAARDDRVHEAHDRRIVVGGIAVVDHVVGDAHVGEAGGVVDAGEHAVQAPGLAEQVGDLVRRGQQRPDLAAGDDPQVVEREHVRGVGHRHDQAPVGVDAHRHRLVAAHRPRVDQLGDAAVDRRARLEQPDARADGARVRQLLAGDQPALEQQLAQAPALRRPVGKRPAQLLDGDVLEPQQDLAERLGPRLRRRLRGRRGGRAGARQRPRIEPLHPRTGQSDILDAAAVGAVARIGARRARRGRSVLRVRGNVRGSAHP